MSVTFYGEECTISADSSGALGVVMNGRRVLRSTYELGKKIEAAGPEGMSTDRVNLTEMDELRRAGTTLRTGAFGARVWVDHLPTPSGYIVPKQKPVPQRTGQFGAVRAPREPFSANADSDRIKPRPWR